MHTFFAFLQDLPQKGAKNRPKEAAFRNLVGIFEETFYI